MEMKYPVSEDSLVTNLAWRCETHCLTNQSTEYRTQDESSATSSDPRYFSGLGRNANELSRTPGKLSSFIVSLYYYFSNPRGMQNIHNLKTQIVRLKTNTSFLTSFTFLRSKRLQVVLTEGILLSRENTTNEKLTNWSLPINFVTGSMPCRLW